MVIVVNDIERTFGGGRIFFSQVVLMGLYKIPAYDRHDPQITYLHPEEKFWAKMAPRSSLAAVDGMKFRVFNGKKPIASPIPITAADPRDFLVNDQPKEFVAEIPRIRVKPEAIERRKTEFAAKGLDWPPHFTEEQKAAEIERVRQLMAPHEARYQAEQAGKQNSPNQTEARLKDAYVIINLLYQEAVEAGRMTPGRLIAQRLLYSIGIGT